MDRDVIPEVFQMTVFDKRLGNNVGYVYQVGRYQTVNGKRFVCSKILHDDNAYYFNGQSRWTVYLKDEDTGIEFKYVDYENASLEIKRNAPKELL